MNNGENTPEKIIRYSSGASKSSSENKGRYDLLPLKAIHRLALRFELGAKKYADRDWEKGLPKDVLINSGLRHFFQYLNKENSEDHLAAVVWNIMALMELEENKKI